MRILALVRNLNRGQAALITLAAVLALSLILIARRGQLTAASEPFAANQWAETCARMGGNKPDSETCFFTEWNAHLAAQNRARSTRDALTMAAIAVVVVWFALAWVWVSGSRPRHPNVA